uniref:BED-type domain-containing protein n=1 Tax=Oryza meridionalis TaxID=40149 RepID=A0A0E0CUT5_9ORYZ
MLAIVMVTVGMDQDCDDVAKQVGTEEEKALNGFKDDKMRAWALFSGNWGPRGREGVIEPTSQRRRRRRGIQSLPATDPPRPIGLSILGSQILGMDQDCDGANHGGTEEERALNGRGDKLENADDMVEQEESSGSAPNPLFLGTRPKRLRSKVWDDFTPIYIDGKLARAECMHCHQIFNSNSTNGTSRLLKHQAKCSPHPQKRPMQQKLPFPPSSQKSLMEPSSDPTQKKLPFLPISQKRCSGTDDAMPHRKDPALPNTLNDINRRSQEIGKSLSRKELTTREQKNPTSPDVTNNDQKDQLDDEHPVLKQKCTPAGTNLKNPEVDQNGLIQTLAMCGYLPLMMHNDSFRKCVPCFDSMGKMPANTNIGGGFNRFIKLAHYIVVLLARSRRMVVLSQVNLQISKGERFHSDPCAACRTASLNPRRTQQWTATGAATTMRESHHTCGVSIARLAGAPLAAVDGGPDPGWHCQGLQVD